MEQSQWTERERIVAAVAKGYGCSIDDLRRPGRDPLLVEARRVACVLLHESGVGATAIGRMVGRDHSTVLHHLNRVQPAPEEMEMRTDLRKTVVRHG